MNITKFANLQLSLSSFYCRAPFDDSKPFLEKSPKFTWGPKLEALMVFTTNGFLTLTSINYVLIQLLVPGSTPVSLLEIKLGFVVLTQFANTGKETTFTSIVCGYRWSCRAALEKAQLVDDFRRDSSLVQQGRELCCCWRTGHQHSRI